MKESWKDIPGYDGKYQADTEGNIRRVYSSGKTRLLRPYHKHMSGSQRMIVKLTRDGKSREEIVMQLIAKTFLGVPPPGHVAYHKNGCQYENHIQNISYISKRELGKRTGAKSRRQPVAKIDCNGEVVEVYSSAREAARKNYMSYQTIIDRCNRKCKSTFAPDGYAYAWMIRKSACDMHCRRLRLRMAICQRHLMWKRSGKADGQTGWSRSTM